ncbi:MAG: D-aminoacylase [Elusimicrobia bacterium]|nr:D-aminoacylase [Elusimicrobiota bacterium]
MRTFLAAALALLPALASAQRYDVLIRNGRVMDGSGNPWFEADVAISGDRVAAVGRLGAADAKRVIDASGLVVAPGFIDVLGQSEYYLLVDHRSLSKLSQGITTEITGEGGSIAPHTEKTLLELKQYLAEKKLTVDWKDLDGYFRRLEKTGTPINLGTNVGAGQVREAILGDENRAPTAGELKAMEALVDEAMRQGALGLSSALIYPPDNYAKTDELIALAKVVARHGGIYATHTRNEGRQIMDALDEAFKIGREAKVPVEIFHLKVAGKPLWGTMPKVVAKIQAARDAGQDVTADVYPYTAGATSLSSALPPWASEGGREKMLARLRDPATRKKIAGDLAEHHDGWENLYLNSGGAAGVMVAKVPKEELRTFGGKTIAQIAKAQGKTEMDALLDFILDNEGGAGAIYFTQHEDDLRVAMSQPWASFCLDWQIAELDGPNYRPYVHPRGWGSYPRILGKYSRELGLFSMEQAIRKMTSMPAQRFGLAGRGLLKPGFFADVAVFDPKTIIDHATFEKPNQQSVGVEYVFVNGQAAFEKGKPTGAMAGRPLRGPGWRPKVD